MRTVYGLETYKVLGAALALNTFTVKDLAAFSGVNETTVRTILGRRGSDVADVTEPSTSRKRGGRLKMYTLRKDRIQVVQQDLAEVSKLVAKLPDTGAREREQTATSSIEPPISMLAAEDTLRRKYAEALSHEEKKELANMASIQLGVARSALQQFASQAVGSPSALARLEQNLNELTAINAVYEAQIVLEAAPFSRNDETNAAREALRTAVTNFAQTNISVIGMASAVAQGTSSLPVATAKLAE